MKYKDKKLGRYRVGVLEGTTKPKSMIAKYPGWCDSCFEYIKVGQKIMWAGKGQTYHSTCYMKGGTKN